MQQVDVMISSAMQWVDLMISSTMQRVDLDLMPVVLLCQLQLCSSSLNAKTSKAYISVHFY